jgi:hypothetical protein
MSSDVLSTASKPRLEDRGYLQASAIKDDSKKKTKAANGSSTKKESRTVASPDAAIPGSSKNPSDWVPFGSKLAASLLCESVKIRRYSFHGLRN